MSRIITVAAAQLGPISLEEPRSSSVQRMITLMREAKKNNANFVVFPELALTTFFPRWYFEKQSEIEQFFEIEMPNESTRPMFEESSELKIGFYLGYAELHIEDGIPHHYNTAILVDDTGKIVGKYRKIHLPGHKEYESWRPFQHLEKRYFETGNLGFPVHQAFGGTIGMCICNDRRWPETFRVMGLQGAELIALGYNTPVHYPLAPEHDHLQDVHNHLVLQAAAYQNGTWIIAVAKAGTEEKCDLIGGTCIIAPTGEIIAKCKTLGDELIVAECDLDRCKEIKENIFNFSLHREPENYTIISSPKKDATK